VLASQGHIRDLVPKPGSVDPSANFEMKWAVAKQAEPRLDAIKQALQQAGMNKLVLATDPDREGEAIAWHLSQVLAVTSHSAHRKEKKRKEKKRKEKKRKEQKRKEKKRKEKKRKEKKRLD